MSRQSDRQGQRSLSAFRAIRSIDYTVIFARDMVSMRHFYESVLGFSLIRELSPKWIEYQVGGNTLALATPSRTAADAPTPNRSAALQLAFKVTASEVDQCADEFWKTASNCFRRRLTSHLDIERCFSGIQMAICSRYMLRFKLVPNSR